MIIYHKICNFKFIELLLIKLDYYFIYNIVFFLKKNYIYKIFLKLHE